jgi:hypothetical protein
MKSDNSTVSSINRNARSPDPQLSRKPVRLDASITGVAEVISARPITEVWIALGGPPPKRGRSRAFFRDGDNPFAVSLNDSKGCWFDYRDGTGGGVLDLIQHVRGGDRRSALSWLANLNGVQLNDRPLTETERRRYASQRAETTMVAAWKDRLVDALKRQREQWWAIYHESRKYLRDNGLESPSGEAAATLYELAEERIEELNMKVDTLAAETILGLISIFRDQTGGRL